MAADRPQRGALPRAVQTPPFRATAVAPATRTPPKPVREAKAVASGVSGHPRPTPMPTRRAPRLELGRVITQT